MNEPIRTRYTLRYKVGNRHIELFNLAASAVREITFVQKNLGATGFETEEQPHHYSQYEIELIRKENS